MRIGLKAAMIEVASGRWRMVLPEAIANTATSVSSARAAYGRTQVTELTSAGYARRSGTKVSGAQTTAPTN